MGHILMGQKIQTSAGRNHQPASVNTNHLSKKKGIGKHLERAAYENKDSLKIKGRVKIVLRVYHLIPQPKPFQPFHFQAGLIF